jgi:hypothetical protein
MRLGKIKGRRIILPATVIPPYVLSKKKNQNKKLYRRSILHGRIPHGQELVI